MAHPTIWRFIEVLRNDVAVQIVRATHFVAGRPAPKRGRIYDTINDRIRTIHSDYANRNIDFM